MVEYFVASILISEDVLQQKFFTIKGDQSPSHFGHLQVLSSRIVVDVIDSTAPIGSIMSILYNLNAYRLIEQQNILPFP
jgi:hypothetical protein